jgi:GT2 family glycosyltransferase
LGGFDETFYLAFEDSDLGWRANLAGLRCVCIPEAVAFHCIVDGYAERGDFLTFHACKNRLRSMIRNAGLPRLAAFLPLYIGYAATDAMVRSPRRPKMRALWWNLVTLGDTLRKRAETQRARKVRDAAIAHLFSPRLFAPERCGNRRRRLTGGHA